MRRSLPPCVALAVLWAGCLPTDAARLPLMDGPEEVFGGWENHMIVCEVPLTLTTPYPIRIVQGELLATFPAEGTIKAQVHHRFTDEELETLWGGEWSERVTRSLEIRPTVQFEDYEVTLEFVWATREGSGLGLVKHYFVCLPEEEGEPRPDRDSSSLIVVPEHGGHSSPP